MKEATVEALEARSIPEPNTGCLLWLGATYSNGYGSVRVGGSRGVVHRTHRLMYMLAHGPIPAGHMVMHRCDQPACINPAHLTTGTPRDNVQDMVQKRRHAHGQTSAMARLSEADVLSIRSRRSEGEPIAVIAKDFGTSPMYVSHIVHGRTWRHLPAPQPHPRVARPRKTFCVKGHPYDAANTYVASSGKRTCRACNRAAAARVARRRK